MQIFVFQPVFTPSGLFVLTFKVYRRFVPASLAKQSHKLREIASVTYVLSYLSAGKRNDGRCLIQSRGTDPVSILETGSEGVWA